MFETKIPKRAKYEDGAGTPQVSPLTSSASGVVTLTTPSGAIWLHARCAAKGLKFGEGTLAGTAGNGYCQTNAAEWVAIPVRGVATVILITVDASQQAIEFFYEMLAG
jgi:hypothetical protein